MGKRGKVCVWGIVFAPTHLGTNGYLGVTKVDRSFEESNPLDSLPIEAMSVCPPHQSAILGRIGQM